MNKKLLSTAIATALGFSFSTATMAAVDLNAGNDPAYFASEMDIDADLGNGIVPIAASVASAINAEVQMGFGFSSNTGEALYVRFDLDNGAQWKSQLTTDNLAIGASGSISMSQGGAPGGSHVIFSVSPGNAGFLEATTVTLDLHDSLPNAANAVGTNPRGITVVNKNAVNLTYGLYTTALAASQKSAPLVQTTGKFIDFTPLLGFKATATAATADVGEDFKKFIGPSTLESIGEITFGTGVSTITPILDETVSNAASSNYTTASTQLVVTGNFAGATTDGVYLSAAPVCPTAGANTATGDFLGELATDGGSASFAVGTSSGGTYLLCFTADTVNAMQEGYFEASYLGNTEEQAARIRRNGVELLAPFFTVHSTYIARFYLTNSSDKDAKFTVAVQKDNGVDGQGNPLPDCTLLAPYDDCPADTTGACTIPANANKLILASELLATGQRCSATFRVAASEEAVHGHYTVRNRNTTDWDSYLLISIGAGNGH